MKIANKKEVNIEIFAKVESGQVFLFNYQYFIKTTKVSDDYNAVCLEDGSLSYIEFDTDVELINCELVIKE